MKCPCISFSKTFQTGSFISGPSVDFMFLLPPSGGSELTFSHAWNIDVYADKPNPPSSPGSSVSAYSEVKPSKVVSRKRWARSLSFELGGDLYAVDIEEGYQPLSSSNRSRARRRNEEDAEEFSGMGVTARPTTTTSNRLTPPAALKVTYRCWSARTATPVEKVKDEDRSGSFIGLFWPFEGAPSS